MTEVNAATLAAFFAAGSPLILSLRIALCMRRESWPATRGMKSTYQDGLLEITFGTAINGEVRRKEKHLDMMTDGSLHHVAMSTRSCDRGHYAPS
jgi:hypothetical protein